VLPADHLIQDVSGFHKAIQSAFVLAQQNKLVTFGIIPMTATGFGYIERGATLGPGEHSFEVARL